MDWKNNQWVGIGAAAVLVLAIVGIFTLRGGPAGSGTTGTLVYTFKCKSTDETFTYTSDEMENKSVEDYAEYMEPYGTPAKCDKCDAKDAERVYYCPQCEKWYAFERKHDMGADVVCPEGHAI